MAHTKSDHWERDDEHWWTDFSPFNGDFKIFQYRLNLGNPVGPLLKRASAIEPPRTQHKAPRSSIKWGTRNLLTMGVNTKRQFFWMIWDTPDFRNVTYIYICIYIYVYIYTYIYILSYILFSDSRKLEVWKDQENSKQRWTNHHWDEKRR